jgi:hypothetical protein
LPSHRYQRLGYGLAELEMFLKEQLLFIFIYIYF